MHILPSTLLDYPTLGSLTEYLKLQRGAGKLHEVVETGAGIVGRASVPLDKVCGTAISALLPERISLLSLGSKDAFTGRVPGMHESSGVPVGSKPICVPMLQSCRSTDGT